MEDYLEAILARVKEKAEGAAPTQDKKKDQDGITCKTCGGEGWVESVKDGHITMLPCPDCYERRQLVRRLRASGINPEDYSRYSLATFDGKRSTQAGRMLDMAKRFLDEHNPGGPGFGLFGASGTGKTHLCIAVCQKLTRRFHEPHFYFAYRSEVPDLLKAARSYTDDYESAMYKWKTCKNLYVDDLFKLSGKVEAGGLLSVDREELRLMYDLVNARYVNHLTTIFSSEYTVNDMTKIDAALGSRIYDMVKPYGMSLQGRNERFH